MAVGLCMRTRSRPSSYSPAPGLRNSSSREPKSAMGCSHAAREGFAIGFKTQSPEQLLPPKLTPPQGSTTNLHARRVYPAHSRATQRPRSLLLTDSSHGTKAQVPWPSHTLDVPDGFSFSHASPGPTNIPGACQNSVWRCHSNHRRGGEKLMEAVHSLVPSQGDAEMGLGWF